MKLSLGLTATALANGSLVAAKDTSIHTPSSFVFQHYNGSVIDGCCEPRANSTTTNVTYAGDFSTQAECEAVCAKDDTCQSYTWQDSHPYGPSDYANLCYLRHDQEFTIVQDPDKTQHDGHFSGRKCPSSPGGNYTDNWCSVTQHPTPSWFNRAK